VPTFADRGCRVVSAADPHGRILCFLDRSRYYFFQVAPQLEYQKQLLINYYRLLAVFMHFNKFIIIAVIIIRIIIVIPYRIMISVTALIEWLLSNCTCCLVLSFVCVDAFVLSVSFFLVTLQLASGLLKERLNI
jgi:hypothetical protein